MAIINYFTTDMANAMRKQIESSVLQKAFPVNSYFISNSTSDPVNILGFGVWTRINGQFLYSGTAASAVGQTGGEATHTLTVQEIPRLAVKTSGAGDSGQMNDGESGRLAVSVGWGPCQTGDGANVITGYGFNAPATGGLSHNNMPPYYTTNIWRRVS